MGAVFVDLTARRLINTVNSFYNALTYLFLSFFLSVTKYVLRDFLLKHLEVAGLLDLWYICIMDLAFM